MFRGRSNPETSSRRGCRNMREARQQRTTQEDDVDLQDHHAPEVSSEPGTMHVKGGPQRKEAVAYHDAAIVGPAPGHNQSTTRTRTGRGNARAAASNTTRAGNKITPSGSGPPTPAQTVAQHELNGSRALAAQVQQVPTRLSFANPDTPRTTWETIGTRANRANSSPDAPAKGAEIPLKKRYEL